MAIPIVYGHWWGYKCWIGHTECLQKTASDLAPKNYYKEAKQEWDMYLVLVKQIRVLMFSSVQFSRSVVPDSLQPHELQHTRPPCPSPTPRVHSDSCPLIPWCHPATSSSVVPFSSCPQSLPASESFPMSQLFAWGGQSTGVSAFVSLKCIIAKWKVIS